MQLIEEQKDKKLSFDEIIEQLEEKGVQFKEISKETAKEKLMNSNFYYKIRSFRKNFPKNKDGKYINLDFFMLNDLATIDMRLRYVLIHMCLDIEHTLKTKIVKDITLDQMEDGIKVVQKFLDDKNKKSKKVIDDYYRPISNERHPNHGLYRKYKKRIPPIWVFCELMTFGDLVAFIEFFYGYKNKPSCYAPLEKNLRYVKNIRNLTAHNSPIINEITLKNQIEFNNNTNRFLYDFLSSVDNLSKKAIRKKLKNTKIHDLCALFYVYHTYVSSTGMKKHRYDELNKFMVRAKRNKELYKKHSNFVSVYNFFDKIIDSFTKNI
ncbi:Abi family protein [Caldifermentibacillus hisashii]|uniref:Abi family protein n=1 Tax=Caldifermentibacillus hisashii TaxID=996558 RepID=UPI0031FDABB5